MMFISFRESNGFCNSYNVFDHSTALLNISGHYFIEMSIFVVC